MRLDHENNLAFDTALALTSGVATDYGQTLDAVKSGSGKEEMYLVASVRSSVTSANSTATLRLTVLNDDAANFGTADTLMDTGALALTALTAGKRLYARRLPFGLKRHTKAVALAGTEDVTGGKVDIFIVDAADFAALNSAS